MRSLLAMMAVSFALSASAGEIHGKVSSPKGGAGVLVYVVQASGAFKPKPATVNQQKMAFVPYVTPVLQGATVTFRNDDPVNHNVFSPDGEGFNLGTWSKGQTKTHTFQQTGIDALLCSLHPEMEGYVVVLQNPYYAMTKDDGSYVIKGVPDGAYTVRAFGKPIKKKKDRKKEFPVTVSGSTSLDLEF